MTFLLVAVKDKPDDARGFMRDAGMSFGGALDPDSDIFTSFQKAARVSVAGTPTNFFLGADGSILGFYVGPLSEPQLDQKIGQLLGAGR